MSYFKIGYLKFVQGFFLIQFVTFKVLHCNVALNHLHVTVPQQILVINLPINSAGTHSLSLCGS